MYFSVGNELVFVAVFSIIVFAIVNYTPKIAQIRTEEKLTNHPIISMAIVPGGLPAGRQTGRVRFVESIASISSKRIFEPFSICPVQP